MAKYNYLRFATYCLIIIFILTLLIFLSLISVAKETVIGRKDKNDFSERDRSTSYTLKYNVSNHNLKTKEFKSWNNIDGKLNNENEVIKQHNIPSHNRVLESNFHSLSNVEAFKGEEVFRFNIKLNSFSKESSDLLD